MNECLLGVFTSGLIYLGMMPVCSTCLYVYYSHKHIQTQQASCNNNNNLKPNCNFVAAFFKQQHHRQLAGWLECCFFSPTVRKIFDVADTSQITCDRHILRFIRFYLYHNCFQLTVHVGNFSLLSLLRCVVWYGVGAMVCWFFVTVHCLIRKILWNLSYRFFSLSCFFYFFGFQCLWVFFCYSTLFFFTAATDLFLDAILRIFNMIFCVFWKIKMGIFHSE